MAVRSPKEHSMELYKSILTLRDEDECFRFFKDLCSMTELYALEQRFDVASMLMDGDIYTDIAAKTRASSATISRVSRMLNYGESGVRDVLVRTKHTEKEGT